MTTAIAVEIPRETSWPARTGRFLFAPIDARVAAIMRIALAIMLVYSFQSAGLHFMPPPHLLSHAAWWYHHLFLTHSYAAAVMVVAIFFGLGIRPRVTGIILFLMLVPLDSLSRGRQSRQVLLFALLAFSLVRSNVRWSVRVWPNRQPPCDAGPIWPIRLMQIQLCLVYAINALAKATPHYLSGDTLVGMAIMRRNFLIHTSSGHVHLGPITLPAALAAVGSLVVESYLAVGFWFRRLRWITAAIGVVFHLTLQFIVHIFMLDLVSMFMYLSFLLPWRVISSKADSSPFHD